MQHQEGNHNNTMAISTQMTEVKAIGCLTYRKALVRKKLVEGKQSTGHCIMKAGVNCDTMRFMLYAKESLESNQINSLIASMESVWIHLYGSQNLYGLKPKA